jgi:hypothetical protein
MLHAEALPVAGTSLASVDLDRIRYATILRRLSEIPRYRNPTPGGSIGCSALA